MGFCLFIIHFTGGAKLEYAALAFSGSEYLATISGVPDFQLTLWFDLYYSIYLLKELLRVGICSTYHWKCD